MAEIHHRLKRKANLLPATLASADQVFLIPDPFITHCYSFQSADGVGLQHKVRLIIKYLINFKYATMKDTDFPSISMNNISNSIIWRY